eukprot:gene6088-9227_t
MLATAMLVMATAAIPPPGSGPQGVDPLAHVLAALQAEHAALVEETEDAEAHGVPVHYERATLALSAYFAGVAAADNTTVSQATLRLQYAAFYTHAPPGVAEALAVGLPVREANDTVYVLQQARTALAVAVAAEAQPPSAGARRPPLPSRNLIGGAICDGYFCNADGAPVFSVGFNTWLARKQPRVAPFDPVPTGVTQESIGFLFIDWQANSTWKAASLVAAKQQLDAAAAINQTVFSLMGGVRLQHSGAALPFAMMLNGTLYAALSGIPLPAPPFLFTMPQWTEAIYPGLNTGNFTSHGVAYDIDNPGVAPVSTAAIHGWLDALGCHPAFGGWILYRAWLEQRHGTIAALNAAWGTGFASFASIASQPTNPGDDPSDPLLLGGP